MDKERYERENRDFKLKEIVEKLHLDPENISQNINYRLTQEYEVPDWIHVDNLDHKDAEMKEYGKGMRSKQRINYKDDADEFEEEEDSDSELKKKRRRTRNKEDDSFAQNGIRKRKLDDDDISQSITSQINLEDDDYIDVSKSYSTQNNKPSNTKMRIKLNSNSNLRIGIYF